MIKKRKVVLFALIKNSKILLEKRQLKGFTQTGYYIPGGAVEKWERIENTLKREVREELGIIPVDFKVLTKNFLSGINNNILMPFIITSWEGQVPDRVLDSNYPLEWVDIDKSLQLLPKEASPEIIQAIRKHLQDL